LPFYSIWYSFLPIFYFSILFRRTRKGLKEVGGRKGRGEGRGERKKGRKEERKKGARGRRKEKSIQIE